MGISGRVVRLDPRIDRLIPPDATLETLADGFAWVEGPVWDRRRDYLLFSDIPNNSVLKWEEKAGVSLFLKPSGYTGPTPFQGREPGSNGLTFDHAGKLVLCEHGDRRVARLEEDGRKTTLVDRYHGKRLNSPNDLVFTSNGDLYFTDPCFGLPETFSDPGRALGFCGVFKLSPDGHLTLLTRELAAPNGVVFSPDEDTMYVSNSETEKAIWIAYPSKADGDRFEGRVFFDASGWTATKPGLPDGMKIDHQGNLFATGPGGLLVLAPDGTHLGGIEMPVAASNCAWGNDGATLYITASSAICRIRLSTKGAGF